MVSQQKLPFYPFTTLRLVQRSRVEPPPKFENPTIEASTHWGLGCIRLYSKDIDSLTRDTSISSVESSQSLTWLHWRYWRVSSEDIDLTLVKTLSWLSWWRHWLDSIVKTLTWREDIDLTLGKKTLTWLQWRHCLDSGEDIVLTLVKKTLTWFWCEDIHLILKMSGHSLSVYKDTGTADTHFVNWRTQMVAQ